MVEEEGAAAAAAAAGSVGAMRRGVGAAAVKTAGPCRLFGERALEETTAAMGQEVVVERD